MAESFSREKLRHASQKEVESIGFIVIISQRGGCKS